MYCIRNRNKCKMLEFAIGRCRISNESALLSSSTTPAELRAVWFDPLRVEVKILASMYFFVFKAFQCTDLNSMFNGLR
jgi:hypothetical protein